MKKTVTLPDGTVEVLEGTAEEIATHEKLIRERARTDAPVKGKKPDVLKGVEPPAPKTSSAEELEEMVRRLREVTPDHFPAPIRPWWDPAWPYGLGQHDGPIWLTSCSRCQMNPCACPGFLITQTTDKILLRG